MRPAVAQCTEYATGPWLIFGVIRGSAARGVGAHYSIFGYLHYRRHPRGVSTLLACDQHWNIYAASILANLLVSALQSPGAFNGKPSSAAAGDVSFGLSTMPRDHCRAHSPGGSCSGFSSLMILLGSLSKPHRRLTQCQNPAVWCCDMQDSAPQTRCHAPSAFGLRGVSSYHVRVDRTQCIQSTSYKDSV